LGRQARGYQRSGAEWLSDLPFGLRARILGDPPGFGKTAQALLAAGLRNATSIVVFSTGLSLNDWKSEAAAVWPELIVRFVGRDGDGRSAPPRRPAKTFKKLRDETLDAYGRRVAERQHRFDARYHDWEERCEGVIRKALEGEMPTLLLSTYESAWRVLDFVEKERYLPEVLVCDESHLLKREASIKSKILRPLIARADATFLLTGTPIHNRAEDLHQLLDLCALGKFGSKWTFARKYFAIEKSMYGVSIGRLLYPDKLKSDLMPYLLRRTEQDAYGELPARIRKIVRVPMVKSDSCWSLRVSRESARHLISKGAESLDRALRAACAAKIDKAAELAAELEEPVILYTVEREHARMLEGALLKRRVSCMRATGDVTAEKRVELIEKWKGGEATALVCTMDAVRESATLTRASAMIFVDLDWLPGKQRQCEGRIDPARQPEGERRPARYYYVVLEGGPDEVVAETLVEKEEAVNAVLGGGDGLAGAMREVALAGAMREVAGAPLSPAVILADLAARLEARAERLGEVGADGWEGECDA